MEVVLCLFNHFIVFLFAFLQDNEKRTPLHAAAYLGDAEIIELLILSGIFFNGEDLCKQAI